MAMLLLMLMSGGTALAAPPLSRAAQSRLDRKLLLQAADASVADLQVLITQGAHVNVQDRFGVTPLMQAVIGNNRSAVRALLAAGADVNLRNLRGDTALDLAQQLGRIDIERLLIDGEINDHVAAKADQTDPRSPRNRASLTTKVIPPPKPGA